MLPITPELIGELLRLPMGQQVTAARQGPFGEIELLVEGDGLPERRAGEPPVRVTLVCHREVRAVEGREGEHEYRLTANWLHSPYERWLFRPWESAE